MIILALYAIVFLVIRYMNSKHTVATTAKSLLKAVIALGLCCFIAMSAINIYMLLSGRNKIIPKDHYADEPFDCIIILGAGLWDGELSPLLEDRVLTGIELYKRGFSPKLLMSGDHGRVEYDEVNAMKAYAIKNDIPKDDIFLDHAGFSTYDSIYRAKHIFGAQRVLIVTQKYHLYRALHIADSLGLEACGVSSDRRPYTLYTNIYNQTREFLARDKEFLKCILKPQSKYLGEKISLSGSAQQTDDKEY